MIPTLIWRTKLSCQYLWIPWSSRHGSKPGPPRSTNGCRVDKGQHCGFWRWPNQNHALWPICWWYDRSPDFVTFHLVLQVPRSSITVMLGLWILSLPASSLNPAQRQALVPPLHLIILLLGSGLVRSWTVEDLRRVYLHPWLACEQKTIKISSLRL